MKFLKTLYKILPSVLTILGTFAIGHNFFGAAVNESLWQELAGAAMLVVGIAISVFIDHTATVEQIQAAIRRLSEVFAALLVAAGKQMTETLKAIVELLLMATPLVYAYFSRQKTQKLARGELEPTDLKH